MIYGENKLIVGKQLYYEMWEMGITPPPHFPALVKPSNNMLKKKTLKKLIMEVMNCTSAINTPDSVENPQL